MVRSTFKLIKADQLLILEVRCDHSFLDVLTKNHLVLKICQLVYKAWKEY